MTQLFILAEPGPNHQPGSTPSRPAQCRPRLSKANRQRQLRLGEDPCEATNVYDPTATQFLDRATPKQVSRYWRRRRHLFGWPRLRRRSRPDVVIIAPFKTA
jgi:hypothetical protein